MIGREKNDRGCVIRACQALFEFIDQQQEARSTFEYQIGMSIFQVYNEKTIDLLSSYKNNEEISISTLHGEIDLQSCIQDAEEIKKSKNQDTDVNLKSHTIFLVSLFKIHEEVKEEISKIQFVELANCEQAAAGKKDKKYRFLANNFNNLASRLAKHSLGEFTKPMDHLQNFLNETMGKETKILFVCCVGPGPMTLKDSLPALRFTSKIREIIQKDSLKSIKEKSEADENAERISQNIESLEKVSDKYATPIVCMSDIQTPRDQIVNIIPVCPNSLGRIKKPTNFRTRSMEIMPAENKINAIIPKEKENSQEDNNNNTPMIEQIELNENKGVENDYQEQTIQLVKQLDATRELNKRLQKEMKYLNFCFVL